MEIIGDFDKDYLSRVEIKPNGSEFMREGEKKRSGSRKSRKALRGDLWKGKQESGAVDRGKCIVKDFIFSQMKYMLMRIMRMREGILGCIREN